MVEARQPRPPLDAAELCELPAPKPEFVQHLGDVSVNGNKGIVRSSRMVMVGGAIAGTERQRAGFTMFMMGA